MNKNGVIGTALVVILIIIILILAISLKSALNKCTLPREPLEKVSYSFNCIKELLIFKIIVGLILVIVAIIIIKIIKFVLKKFRSH